MKTTKKTVKARSKKMTIASPVKKKLEYEKDFSKWAEDQANLLRKKEFTKLDIDHLIEEIEDLSKREKQRLISYLENLLMHKLKVKFQPEKYTKSWDNSIELASHKVQKTLLENPSLKPKLKDILDDAYFSARLLAASETKFNKEIFPDECPWTLKDIFPNLDKKYI
jgi:Domain of unknown function DUF29